MRPKSLLLNMPLHFEKLPKHIQERIIRDNPDFRPVASRIAKPAKASPLDRVAQKHKAGPCSVAISVDLIVCSKRVMDSDNLAASCKPLRDAIATSLGIDDGSKSLVWNYHWVKTALEGVIVRIQAMTE